MAVIFYFNQCSFSFKVINDSLSCFISVHSGIFRIIVCDFSVISHDIDNFKVMTKSYFKVVRVMGRSNLYNACTKVHFNIIICNDRYFSVNDRKNNCFADQIPVAFIIRIYCNSGIAKQCFRTCCCKFKILVCILDFVAKMPEMTCLVFIFNLGV